MTAGVDSEVAPALAGLLAAAESLRELVAGLAPDQVWTQSSADVIRLLRAHSALASVVEAAGLALVREADVRCLAADHGQSSTSVWLAQLLRLHPAEAKTRVTEADVLARTATNTAAALLGGKVNPDQARAITTALTEIAKVGAAGDVTNAEATLLDEARVRHPGKLKQLGE